MLASLPLTSESVRNAAAYIEKTYGVLRGKPLLDQFETEFECIVVLYQPATVEFKSEEDLTLFLLRWS